MLHTPEQDHAELCLHASRCAQGVEPKLTFPRHLARDEQSVGHKNLCEVCQKLDDETVKSNHAHKTFVHKRRQRNQCLGRKVESKRALSLFFFFKKDKSYCTMFYVDRNDSVNRDTVKRDGIYTQSKKVLD